MPVDAILSIMFNWKVSPVLKVSGLSGVLNVTSKDI
jgi:hypothetical protein